MVRELPWRAVTIDIKLDVYETGPPQWKRVRLLFVQRLEFREVEVGKKG